MLNQLLFSFVAPQIWLQVLLTIVGIIVVLWGADRLTDGAVGLAERMGVPQIVIGLTIVAMGTSMPEFFVSFMSAINGTPDLAVGNVVGSNIFNALLIVGVAAMVSPIAILHDTVRKDIPFAIIASVVLMILCNDSGINRLDALIMLMMFIFYIITTLRGAKQEKIEESSLDSSTQSDKDSKKKQVGVGKAILLTVVGLVSLILGSNVFVDNVSAIAATLGTSLPELATSVVAARRGNSGIAIGNVIGSNVFNILMILGITGLIAPMQISGITFVDLSVMVLSMVLIWLVSFTRYRIERWEGLVLVTAFASYLSYLIVQAV